MSQLPEIISCGHIENKLMYPHCNPGLELVLVEEGHLEWAVGGIPEVLNPGTVFFTLPWQPHGSRNVREPKNRIYYALFALAEPYEMATDAIRMPASLGFTADEEAMLARVLTTATHHAWPASDLIKVLFPELIQRLKGLTEEDCSVARSLLRTLVSELVRIIIQFPQHRIRESPAEQRIRTFLSTLFRQLDRPWTLDEMAAACSVKRTQLAKITKQVTGYPPLQYLSRIRFQRACELLHATNSSITDIAFDCGYGSSQYFAETFKKQARMTPTEYRCYLPELDTIMQINWNYPQHRSILEEQQRAAAFHTSPLHIMPR